MYRDYKLIIDINHEYFSGFIEYSTRSTLEVYQVYTIDKDKKNKYKQINKQ